MSAHITIHNGRRYGQYGIASNCLFFQNDYLKVDVFDNYLVFSIPTIDYSGRMYKTSRLSGRDGKSGLWRSLTIVNDLLNIGKFKIDKEDSTEDEMVVYFK